jgi:hypothetical protein
MLIAFKFLLGLVLPEKCSLMTESSFHEPLTKRKKSGLIIRDFCSNEGTHESTYYNWANKLNKKVVLAWRLFPPALFTRTLM